MVLFENEKDHDDAQQGLFTVKATASAVSTTADRYLMCQGIASYKKEMTNVDQLTLPFQDIK